MLHNTPKVIVQTGHDGQIVLPPDLFRSRSSPPPTQPSAQGQAAPQSLAPADAQTGPTA